MKINLSNSQRKYSSEDINNLLPKWNDIFTTVLGYDFIPSMLAKYSDNLYVNLNIVGKDKIHEINKEFRSTDKPTDVISFPMLEMSNGKLLQEISSVDVERDDEGNSLLCLGDIIICPEIAGINAEDYGHSFDREMAFLFAHSMLHLLGFDHMNPDDEKLMITYQKKIMCDIGVAFDDEIEFVSPDFVSKKALGNEWELINAETGTKVNWVCDSHPCVIYTKYELPAYSLLRVLDPDYREGFIRDTGR